MASDQNAADSGQFDAAAVREASGALGSGAGAGAGGVGASAGMCHQSFGWAATRKANTLCRGDDSIWFFFKVVTFSHPPERGPLGVVASRTGLPAQTLIGIGSWSAGALITLGTCGS